MQTSPLVTTVTCNCSPLKYPTKTSYPQSREKHAACVHENHVYVCAGKDGTISLKDFWRLHLGSHKWEKVCYRGDTPHHLEGHTLVSCKKLLLLFGGEFGDALTESSLWIINPDLGYIRHTSLDPGSERPCVRRHHSAVVYQGAMYIYGGLVDVKGSSPELWCYQVDDEEWELLSPRQPVSETPGARYGHTAVVYNKRMWVYGGMTDLTPKQDLWSYSFSLNRWEKMKFKYGPPQLTGHSAAVVGTRMLIFGGETNREPVNQLWCFCFKMEKWTQVILREQIPSSRTFHCLLSVYPSVQQDATVKASSMPYLQKKLRQMKLERPRSSPGVRSGSGGGGSDQSESQRCLNFEKTASDRELNRLICDNHIDINVGRGDGSVVDSGRVVQFQRGESEESLKLYPAPAEYVEDNSPLVPKKTDWNYNAVDQLDRNAVHKGIDNPGISHSTEELINEQRSKNSPDLAPQWSINEQRLKNSPDLALQCPINSDTCDVYSYTNPAYRRSVSCADDTEQIKPLACQIRGGCTSVERTNSECLVRDGDSQRVGDKEGVSAKRSRLDLELVLEDLEFSDCFPQDVKVPYPSSNCSRFRSYISTESLVTDMDGIETIELENVLSRGRSKSECDMTNVSGKNGSVSARFDKNKERVYLESIDVNSERKQTGSCSSLHQTCSNSLRKSQTDSMCYAENHFSEHNETHIQQFDNQSGNVKPQREVTHAQRTDGRQKLQRRETTEMETSFQTAPSRNQYQTSNKKYKARQLKQSKSTVEAPYLLLLGGKDRQIPCFSIKPLPLWKLHVT